MNREANKELIRFLRQFVSDNRVELFQQILNERTRYITVVLEDIFQPHNASAVLRTCDCFGVQDVHIVENYNEFKPNKDIVLGSAQWLTINKYSGAQNNTTEALLKLKEDGYRIVATSPHSKDLKISDFNITNGKAAFVFGSERLGISETVKKHADEFVKIPMYGFTESFNISVSAAMILHTVTEILRVSSIDYRLTGYEKDHLELLWLRNTIKKVELLESKFWQTYTGKKLQ